MAAKRRAVSIAVLTLSAVVLAYLGFRSRRAEDDPASYRWIKRRSQRNRVLHQKNRALEVFQLAAESKILGAAVWHWPQLKGAAQHDR